MSCKTFQSTTFNNNRLRTQHRGIRREQRDGVKQRVVTRQTGNVNVNFVEWTECITAFNQRSEFKCRPHIKTVEDFKVEFGIRFLCAFDTFRTNVGSDNFLGNAGQSTLSSFPTRNRFPTQRHQHSPKQGLSRDIL